MTTMTEMIGEAVVVTPSAAAGRNLSGPHGQLLTMKFLKPQSHHRYRVNIGFRVQESADGNYHIANSQILTIFG